MHVCERLLKPRFGTASNTFRAKVRDLTQGKLRGRSRGQWRRLFPRTKIGRNEELNSLTIIEFYETSNEIGIDEPRTAADA